ncbi:hypothetical protein Acid345_1276 [Candidatus Koribacter versatilis Ellin345]|uniref:Integral membrane protein n=1 Tax=Koribacter versatilis (strain Ellin345) TaxID=204669 RepID=Q1IS72_KORVE|nr:hypothetical protein [Candidatus Koribacter versatilis]ABF40278.1 hypothetical protein Acid345_1276 [Candidatus Koribacter versatilis Ellin345]
MSGAWVLLIFGIVIVSTMMLLLHLTKLGHIVHCHIPDRPRRRLFVATVAFLATFVGVRLLVLCITHSIGPFGWVMMGGRHIHHLVWGILILLAVGYAWLADLGSGNSPTDIFVNRLLASMYGVGAALTLDEFALWLNLRDVYWAKEGRSSIDAVIIFAALLGIGAWGSPLLHHFFFKRKHTKKIQDADCE